MPDLFEHIQEHQLATLARLVTDVHYSGIDHSAFVYDDCNAPIPEPHHIGLQGAVAVLVASKKAKFITAITG